MNNKICIGYLTNIRDMFVIGSKQCEGEALKYHQNFINALNYAIELINNAERPQGKWIEGGKDVTGQYFYDEFICNKCSVVVTDKSNFCPRCGADMRGGEKNESD